MTRKRRTRTVREGQPARFGGITIEVRRKRRHAGQYRVVVSEIVEKERGAAQDQSDLACACDVDLDAARLPGA